MTALVSEIEIQGSKRLSHLLSHRASEWLTAPPRLSALCYAASEERKGDLVWTGQLASGRLRGTGIPLAGYYCQVKYRTPS